MTKDGLNNLDIAYNYLNLPTEVRGGGGDVKVRYNYLADGTKIESVDDAGSGYAYIGSLVYRKSNAGYELESVPFSAGRIEQTTSGYDISYHLTDQVGSVRAVINAVGEVLQQSDYYAFGLRHASTDFATNDNRYQLTGKESQKDFGFNYLDFHARQYDPTGILFTSQDPLQDKYASTSSYAYCLNNPVIHIDPDGCSTHTTASGKVIYVRDDDDHNIYRHDDFKESNYSAENTSAGGENMGESLHALSFADQNKYHKDGTVVAHKNMTINFDSEELTEKAQAIMDSNPSLVQYAKKAKTGGEYDIKSHTQEGSKLYGKYASPRDAGNFVAGIVAASKGRIGEAVAKFGYGMYNMTGNSIPLTAIGVAAVGIRTLSNPIVGVSSVIMIGETGEDKLSQRSINLGAKYYRKNK